MLTADELRDAWELVGRGEIERLHVTTVRAHRVRNTWRALEWALHAYAGEALTGPDARLDCLATMVRAGVGALRERPPK